MRKLLIGVMMAGMLGASNVWAGFGDVLQGVGSDIVSNSKIEFLKRAELGYGWRLDKSDTDGAVTALLGIWGYRFLHLNVGVYDPFSERNNEIPGLLLGVSLDEVVRLIAPNMSDTVRDVMPPVIRPVWNALTFSVGPGLSFNGEGVVPISAINFQLQFGGSED